MTPKSTRRVQANVGDATVYSRYCGVWTWSTYPSMLTKVKDPLPVEKEVNVTYTKCYAHMQRSTLEIPRDALILDSKWGLC